MNDIITKWFNANQKNKAEKNKQIPKSSNLRESTSGKNINEDILGNIKYVLNQYDRKEIKKTEMVEMVSELTKILVNEEVDETPLFGMSKEETLAKMKEDPVWFIESYCRLEGDKPFKLYDYQKEFIKQVLANKYIIINKSRQMGISQVAGAFCLWYALVKPKKEIIIISLNNSEAEYFIDRRIWESYDVLPKFIKGNKLKKNTSDKIEFANGSKIEAMANTKKALRGRSPSIVLIDEMAFQGQAQEMITSAMPALQMGEHLILISTPNGTNDAGEFFYKTWGKAVKKESDFYPLKINWYENPMYNPEAPKKVDWQKNEWAMSQFRNYTNPSSFKQEILGEFIDIDQDPSNDISAGVSGASGEQAVSPAKPAYNPPEFIKKYWRERLNVGDMQK